MVNKNNEPHGYGRTIIKNRLFSDGMWENGIENGIHRTIFYDGQYGGKDQYINGVMNINDWY